ncbi:MAG: ATPase [Clostridia bacterium]|jgi:predicted NACHT family NTPase|nr:ATPase [Clostridia bacterium]MDD4571246.1 ATPase [Clostridia bacterium]
MKKGKVSHVFPGSNTPQGFYSFYAEGLSPMEHVFVLKGGPGTGKSTLMRKIAHNMTERGYDVELWQCSSDNNSLDGVIIGNLGVAVVDGTAPQAVVS